MIQRPPGPLPLIRRIQVEGVRRAALRAAMGAHCGPPCTWCTHCAALPDEVIMDLRMAHTLQKAPTSWTFPGVPRCLLGCAHFPGAVGRFPAWERVLGTDLKTSVNYAPSICRGFLWPIYVPPMRGCKDMKCGGLYPTHCPPRSHAVVPGIPGAPGNKSSAQ